MFFSCFEDDLAQCYSVFDSCCNKSLLAWTIYELKDERLSLQDFYDRVQSDVERNHLLKEARVGKSKEELDAISDLGELIVLKQIARLNFLIRVATEV